ncbi:Hypothetical predicted protein [Paramuricea clavata]|uniref:Uncharacterized protein n=1 Tax=Paramuricea clavata TaxID=317549 RepID=A0A7D9LVY7_PARCT|nr:Hypothetical predicted protein [Paramuricea clavata]
MTFVMSALIWLRPFKKFKTVDLRWSNPITVLVPREHPFDPLLKALTFSSSGASGPEKMCSLAFSSTEEISLLPLNSVSLYRRLGSRHILLPLVDMLLCHSKLI